MRVLHLVKTSDGGHWALLQMKELVSLGMDVHALLPPGGRLLSEYRRAGIAVHELSTDIPTTTPHRFPAVLSGIRSAVKHVCPEIIHSHTVGSTLALRFALGRTHPIPRFFQVPGPLHMEHTLYRNIELANAGGRDFWIASSEYTRRLYARAGIDEGRLFLSYYGTDIAAHPRSRSGRLRQELRLSDTDLLVGMVAYMYPPKWYLGQRRGIKGHEDLIEACGLLRDQKIPLTCVFVGGSWGRSLRYETRLRRLASSRLGDAAVFIGTRTDVPDLYGDLDVAVHPSLSENAGGAVESLLHEVPTVASSAGGLPELVRDGVTGWLVLPAAPADLARAILEALEAPAVGKQRARRGRDLTSEMFDVRRTAAEVASVYKHVCNGSSNLNEIQENARSYSR